MFSLPYQLYKYSLLALSLMSMYAWFFWYLSIPIIILTFIITIIYLINNPEHFQNKKELIIPFFILLIFEIYFIKDSTIVSLFSAILRAFIIGAIIFLTDNKKIDLLKFMTKSIGIILLISIFFWILFLIGIPLPSTLTDYQNGKYLYENYYFFLYNLKLQVFFIPRFSSIFPEPGNLALITVFLIVANSFNFKNFWVFILLVATLLSFSLAGYILLFLSLTLYLINFSKHPIRNYLIFASFIVAFVLFFKNFNDGDNPVKILIFDRLQIEDGDIAGNNRTTFLFNDFFNKFIQKKEIIYGIGAKKYSMMTWGGGTAGIKVFLVMHGIIGLILMLSFYLTCYNNYKSRLGLILLVTYFVCFLQNTYPLAEIVLIVFITGIANLTVNQLNKSKNGI